MWSPVQKERDSCPHLAESVTSRSGADTWQQLHRCRAATESSGGAALPQVSNAIYFISVFFGGKIINQLHLYLKWLLEAKPAHRRASVPAPGRSHGLSECNSRRGMRSPLAVPVCVPAAASCVRPSCEPISVKEVCK